MGLGVGWAHRHTSNRVAAGASSSSRFRRRRARGPRRRHPGNEAATEERWQGGAFKNARLNLV